MTRELFRYVALGDSTAVGVGSDQDGGYPERLYQRLKAAGVHAGILNLGQSGAVARDVLDGQVARAVSKRPALVTLGIGSNDLWRLLPTQVYADELRQIADALERSGAQVVVSNLSDLSLAPVSALAETLLSVPMAVFADRIAAFNAHLNALSRRPGFEVVDLFSSSRHELKQHPEYFAPDGFHPSREGYDRWAELMWPAVERAAMRVLAPEVRGSA